MKIVTLVENSSLDSNLDCEHGLSLYIEAGNHKILFDTGETDLFAKNAEKLSVNLSDVDMVVISHGHYDHIGGLVHFLKINQKAKVYLKKEVFDYQYIAIRDGIQYDIGYLPDLKNYFHRFVFLETACTLIENIFIIANFDHHFPAPKSNCTLFKQDKADLLLDDFNHELIYVIHTENGLVVLSGCAHNGILNIVSTIQRFFPSKNIHAVISGFHLIDNSRPNETETDEEITFIGEQLKRLCPSSIFYTGHCTSERAMKILSNILKDKLHCISTGLITQL